MEFFKSDEIYEFMEKRKKFLTISLFLVLSSLVLLFIKGLNFGIDFAGGTIIQVQYKSEAPIDKIRDILSKESEFTNASITKFGSDNEILIKISSSTTSIKSDIGDRVQKLLQNSGEFEIRRVDMVGPKVGDELREKGIMALTLSIIAILVYVSFRFEWRFAVAAIFALIHDVSIAIGAIIIFDVDVNLDILAAILTILGYSLNDTIIVFDRIRENITDSKSINLNEIIDEAISKTLARTTITSLTTFFVVLTLFMFGGEIISGFSFTLLVGVIVGTYSSIFIAASFLVELKFSISSYREALAKKAQREREKEKLRSMYEQGVV
jgi:preprotein translocase subunit SecF